MINRVILLLCISVAISTAFKCDGVNECGNPTDQCCGSVCYNPNLYSCGAGGVLCGSGTAACGTACYDPSNYKCCGGTTIAQLTQACDGESTPAPTSSPTSAPTAAPTSAPTAAPTSAPSGCTSTSCGAGLSCCASPAGVACYDPSYYTCSGGMLCANTASGPRYACGSQCYDPSLYYCCNSNLYQSGHASACTPTAAPTQPPPPTTPAPTPTYSHAYAPDKLYRYYQTTGLHSSTSSFTADIGVTYPIEISWEANRILTNDNSTAAVFTGAFVAAQASLKVTYFTPSSGNLVVGSTSCSDSSYAACQSSTTSCYPISNYYDITVCPCSSCSVTAKYLLTGTTTPQTAYINLGQVTSPLTLSLTLSTPTQSYLYITITELTLYTV